ncbi:hypothetical protein CLIB1423_32S00628 [[Candida] railenensis]|uniref:SUN domain-containing protein n=1 Tax=[Candida] railenensis TaxID=45579 RepID=A0A9P0QVD4_9ASCO|nr:hypothetical protein CLIB1423_32S00628 [[Candida] railenensis]
MASNFPSIPRVTGDTDDDISIHLYNKVGPSRPLPHRNFDEDILDILQEDEDDLDANSAIDFNKKYQLYQSTGQLADDEEYPSDEYDVDTEVEDDRDENAAFKESINKSRPKEKPPVPSIFEEFSNVKKSANNAFKAKSMANFFTNGFTNGINNRIVLFSLWFVLLLAFVGFLFSSRSRDSLPIQLPVNSESFTSTFKSITSKLSYLESATDKLSEKQAALESNQNLMASNLNKKFEVISSKFQEIESTLVDSRSFKNLYKEFDDMKTSVSSIIENSDPNQLETKLNFVSKKLNELSDISSSMESIKSEILTKLLDQLPERIPIYIKDKKVHFIPEFQKFLYSFIEKYNQENPVLDDETKKKLQLGSAGGNGNINKGKLETYLKNKFDENNKEIWAKLTNLIDDLTIVNNSTDTKLFEKNANHLLLDNLLDIFSKGSVKINYADYNLGARILGFLTSLGGSESSSKPLARRVFLGWYDYLKSPNNWNYNANNVLVDGGKIWECLSNQCSIGIRLFNPVILTDIIVKSGTFDPSEFSAPVGVSLYIKPKYQDKVGEVLKVISTFNDDSEVEDTNKYLKKFVKVKSFKLNPAKSINHLKLPVNLINLKVPVRDIYLKLTCAPGKNCAIFNTKVYGITEYNTYKFSNDVDLMVEKLKLQENVEEEEEEEEENSDEYIYEREFESNAEILGDDELLW